MDVASSTQMPPAPPRRVVPRLAARLSLGVLLAVALLAGAFGWYAHGQLRAEYREAAQQQGVALAAAFDAGFTVEDLERPSALRQRLERLVDGVPRLARASIHAISDGAPRRVATTDPAAMEGPVDPADIGAIPGAPEAYRTASAGAGSELTVPLLGQGAVPVATLSLLLDVEPGRAQLVRWARELALAALAAALAAGALTLVLAYRMLVRPLRLLGAATRRVARGELVSRLGGRRRDEIGDLARDIDAMARALEEVRERGRLTVAKLRRARDEEALLRHVAEAVAAGRPADEVFRLAARSAAAVLGAEGAAVLECTEGGPEVRGAWAGAESARPRRDAEGAAAIAARRGRPARVVGTAAGAGGPVPCTLVAAPVRLEGRPWGAVEAVALRADGLRSDAEASLGRIARIVELAIEEARARARLRAEAATDSLTGLPNHRAFQEALAREVSRARRHRRPLSLVVLDLDHFKRINDTFGHQAGDEVLLETAARLRRMVREGDTLARVGGEEFAWLMPEAAGLHAWQAAERARAAVGARPFPGVGYVTISGGVCDTEHARTGDELLRQADLALYWSKEHGRDMVFRYAPAVVEALSDAEKTARLGRRQAQQSIRVLAQALDARDPGTREHSRRVGDLAAALAKSLGWPAARAELLREAGLVHDVGKIAVPDAVLSKPGPLSEAERQAVQAHAVMGAEIVSDVLASEQVAWVRGNHERWDGTGYPDGLSGGAIPEGARILCLADAWDTMIAARGYAPARTPEAALEEIRRERGRQFWPEGVDALARLLATGALPHGLAPPPAAGPA